MTMPHLMNCDHSEEGWCLGCVKKLWEEKDRLERRLGLPFNGPLAVAYAAEEWHCGRISADDLREVVCRFTESVDEEQGPLTECITPYEAKAGMHLLDQDGQLWVRTPHSGWLRCTWTPSPVNGRVFLRKLVNVHLSAADYS